VTSRRKLVPCGIAAPKFCAMVWPMSASVSRTPRFAPVAAAGEYARIGTYSRSDRWFPSGDGVAAVIGGYHQEIHRAELRQEGR